MAPNIMLLYYANCQFPAGNLVHSFIFLTFEISKEMYEVQLYISKLTGENCMTSLTIHCWIVASNTCGISSKKIYDTLLYSSDMLCELGQSFLENQYLYCYVWIISRKLRFILLYVSHRRFHIDTALVLLLTAVNLCFSIICIFFKLWRCSLPYDACM